MAGGNIIVGDKAMQRAAAAIIDELAARAGASAKDRADIRICRTMSLQRSHSGEPSQPQKFLRLIGCQDPGARETGAHLPRAVAG
jgi:hypothetical protein